MSAESRLSVAAAEYERAARALGYVPMPRHRPAPHAAIGDGARRAMPAVDGDGEGYRMPSGTEDDGALERIVYGLGRALERAIQEARFPGSIVNVGKVSR